MGYKGKNLEKALNMCLCIWYIGDKKMKQVNVKGIIYPVESEDDLITLTHQLAREGYSTREIAQILGLTEKKVKRYMEDCW